MFVTRSRLLLNATKRAAAPQAHFYTTDAGRSIVTLKDIKYTATARAAGKGRSGAVRSDDETPLKLNLAYPKALGGSGDGTTPEQLFAMGYASCFLGAMQLMAGRLEAEGMGGFGIAVDIKVEGVEDEEVIKAGHEACPYSRALMHGVNVNVSKA
ncbi:OsmC/Ohr family [Chiua virens]|nr:OsmC/Ohr family [Chiua virens]